MIDSMRPLFVEQGVFLLQSKENQRKETLICRGALWVPILLFSTWLLKKTVENDILRISRYYLLGFVFGDKRS